MDFALVLILARFGVSCVEHIINKQYFCKKKVNKQYMWSIRKTTAHIHKQTQSSIK
jgi:hypothetical protein